MKYLLLPVLLLLLTLMNSCQKDRILTSKDALLYLSEDTLHFDTVFTTTGSTTQYFKIFNPNSQKLILSNIRLMGGNGSVFKVNIDGVPGSNFDEVEIAAGDSIYGFVTTVINPNSQDLPFVVRDSLQITFNGNKRLLQLEAYGKNAYFLRNKTITKDTTWSKKLPIVILGQLKVNEAVTLTIEKGTRIYTNALAPIQIHGTLRALGEKQDSNRIVFTGDRLDEPYKNYPGSWPGIYFNKTSNNNILSYCIIKNAYQGVICLQEASNALPKLTLQECVFDNIYDVAIGAGKSSITARNCLISNSGYGAYLTAGGNYSFLHCTFAGIGNNYVAHKNATFTATNADADGNTDALSCTLDNCIVYGEGGTVDNELVVSKKGSNPFLVAVNNTLYKNKNANNLIGFTNSINNQLPQFTTIDVTKRIFDFRLKATSPCINTGNSTYAITTDLDGNPRPVGIPDMGCYEMP